MRSAARSESPSTFSPALALSIHVIASSNFIHTFFTCFHFGERRLTGPHFSSSPFVLLRSHGRSKRATNTHFLTIPEQVRFCSRFLFMICRKEGEPEREGDDEGRLRREEKTGPRLEAAKNQGFLVENNLSQRPFEHVKSRPCIE